MVSKNIKFRKFIAIVLLLFTVFFSEGCRLLFVNNPEKKAAKKAEKQEKKAEKDYRDAVETHYKHQDKATYRRMKKDLKKAEKAMKKKIKKNKSGWRCR